MAKQHKTKNYMWLDTSGMARWIEELDKASDNIEEIVEEALTRTAEKIQADVMEAMQDRHLPAKGKYATGETKGKVLKNQRVEWDGGKARIRVGFGKDESEVSHYLISGVWGHSKDGKGNGPIDPVTGKKKARMKPDKKLQEIFLKKNYMRERTKEMIKFFQDKLKELTGKAFD